MVYIVHGAMMNKQYETKVSTTENDATERLKKHEIYWSYQQNMTYYFTVYWFYEQEYTHYGSLVY